MFSGSKRISPVRSSGLEADAQQREIVFENLGFLQFAGFFQKCGWLKSIFDARANSLLEFCVGQSFSIWLDQFVNTITKYEQLIAGRNFGFGFGHGIIGEASNRRTARAKCGRAPGLAEQRGRMTAAGIDQASFVRRINAIPDSEEEIILILHLEGRVECRQHR